MSSAFNIPAGFALVPLEPTLDMGWAYLKAARASSPTIEHSFNHAGYRAALAAAPAPPVDAVPGEPVAGDRVRRLAEDWAEDCVRAGYVTTIKCKSYRPMVDAINSLAASVASRAGSEPVAGAE